MDLSPWIVAFGSGVFGAAMGGLPSFIICGLLVIANLPELGFGLYFGPHISFAGATAAAAYAYRKGLVGDSGQDILMPLIKLNDGMTLVVGGIFGMIGHGIFSLFTSIGLQTDGVALTVVASGLLCKFIFSKEKLTFGSYSLPNDGAGFNLLILGLGVGALSAYVGIVTKNPALCFGVAAVSLIVIQICGAGPVTHPVALTAALAGMMSGSVWIGMLVGVIAIFLWDFFCKVINSKDTYIDPPACTIAILTAIILKIWS